MVAQTNRFMSCAQQRAEERVRHLLLDGKLEVSCPAIAELTTSVIALADGTRRKALLPLATEAIEYALVRRGADVLVSCYATSNTPTVYQLNRSIELPRLLKSCGDSLFELAAHECDETSRKIKTRIANRALQTTVVSDPEGVVPTTLQYGGQQETPRQQVPLVFGYEATICPSSPRSPGRSTRADVHALLFEGHLWAFVRGRRISLMRGPIMLAVQRMVCAVRSLVDSWDSARPTYVRLRAATFGIAVHKTPERLVRLELSSHKEGKLVVTPITMQEAALPILKLTSDLLRSLVTADRGQNRNLRVQALRQEVRSLRREIRSKRSSNSLVNLDPDRLRMHHANHPLKSSASERLPSLRFEERWRICLEGLDANSVFMCGDRLVIASQNHLVATCRNDGKVIWARPGPPATTTMAGSVLIRVSIEGQVELCSVENGQPYCTTHISPRIGGPVQGMMAGGTHVPPVAVITEGSHRLVALDVRTGEPRWRFASHSGGEFRMTKAGRLLLLTCAEEAIHAIDVATGEDVWRFVGRGCFQSKPLVAHETVAATAAQGGRQGQLVALDVYSGKLRWRQTLNGLPISDPCTTANTVLVPTSRHEPTLSAYCLHQGKPKWETKDPGIGIGGAGIAVDELWVLNAPLGRVSAVDVQSGSLRWSQNLADALADEIPRRLEPVLRGGALFVPASSVHVLRPSDGQRLSANLPCDLVPDLMRVDERGWIYVAEESGYIAGYAPIPTLTLIQGGLRKTPPLASRTGDS